MISRFTKHTTSQIWYRTLRKYRRVQRHLQSTPEPSTQPRLRRKLRALARRIQQLNHRWKLGFASSLLTAWLAYAPAAQAQSFPPVFELSSLASGDGSQGLVINGIDEDDRSGISVSSAGDVNGDGLNDFLIGAYAADPSGNADAGESYLIFGRASFGGPVLELSSLASGDGSQGFVINGRDAGDYSGVSVSSAGDVNGDGFDDLLISAPSADPSGRDFAGESYLIFGRASFGGPVLELSSLASGDGSQGVVINGIDAGDDSGFSVSSAGDVNGDGLDDLLIGAFRADPNGNNRAGESYLVFGRASFDDPVLELSSLASGDGSQGVVINGIDAYDESGRSVSSAGDVNGDGFDDLLIGALRADPNGNSYAGESYLVFGRASFGEPILELSSLASGDGSQGVVINGIDPFDFSGESVSSAGDVNGDGLNDFLIGAPSAGPNGNFDAGETYLIFGRSSFGGPVLELSSLASGDGSLGIVINGTDAQDRSGTSVSSAGDVNGDGLDDLLIGAFGADPNGNGNAGESYLNFVLRYLVGFVLLRSCELSGDGSLGFVFNGIDTGDFSGYSVSSAGDVNGDGLDDLLIGSWRADPNGTDLAGESYLIFGRGSGNPTSLEDQISASIQLYPNPSLSRVQVAGFRGAVEFTLSDARGKVLRRGQGKDDFEIDLEALPAGMYYLNFTYQGLSFSKPILKP